MEIKATYSEPTTIWRLQHPDGSRARAMIVPHGFGCSLVWWVNEQVEGAEEFPEWQPALDQADELRMTMESEGWIAS
jgi:hypothetical protein